MEVNARCPHRVFRNVLGPAATAALLDYAVSREADFQAGRAYDRRSGAEQIDRTRRDCVLLADLGAFRAPLERFVRSIITPTLGELRLNEPSGEPKEFEISAYGDGGHFNAHIDTVEALNQVRILSCVYYFAATPPRFSGGALRLHAFPSRAGAQTDAPPYVDVAPETDTFVAFASWLRHEVLPVRVPSGAWADRRFAINCWVHRTAEQPAGVR
ncbi:MAG: 2OG-Fe(II) oxygenase [Candidatus Eremiobacteraeota bacterium]|nr:2OG-Fe(II) oxygenase [Candidatus Eremiobacteraeota bacterium]